MIPLTIDYFRLVQMVKFFLIFEILCCVITSNLFFVLEFIYSAILVFISIGMISLMFCVSIISFVGGNEGVCFRLASSLRIYGDFNYGLLFTSICF